MVSHVPDAPPLRVLVADDYPDCAESVAVFLSLSGCHTQVAHDGEAALNCARTWEPHVCVLDLSMPKVDGWEVARRLRQHRPSGRLLLIAMTGWTNAATKHCAYQVGFDYFLRKPVDPEQLLRIVLSARRPARPRVVCLRNPAAAADAAVIPPVAELQILGVVSPHATR